MSLRRHRLRILAVDPHCHWCRKKLTIHNSTIDHLLARSRGGTNDPTNLVLACFPCNNGRMDGLTFTPPRYRPETPWLAARTTEQAKLYAAWRLNAMDRATQSLTGCKPWKRTTRTVEDDPVLSTDQEKTS